MAQPRPIRLELESAPVVARTRKLRASWRATFDDDINAFHSIDCEPQLQNLPTSTMKQVRVNKQKLLTILMQNRDEHRGIFLEAQKTFRTVAIKALDAQLKAARSGKPFQLTSLVTLMAPEDHTKDYERCIEMLKMSVDADIVITEQEFQNYVQDIWHWSRDWASNSLRYMNANSRHYGKVAALSNSGE